MLLLATDCLSATPTRSLAQVQPPAVASAHTGAPLAPVSADQAKQAIDILQDDQKRAALLQTLRTIAGTAPATAPATASPAAPASPAAAAPSTTGLAGRSLVQFSDWLSSLSHRLAKAAKSASDVRAIRTWLAHLATDPDSRTQAVDIAWRVGLVLAAALAAMLAVARLLGRPFAALDRQAARRGAIETAPASPGGPDEPTRRLNQIFRGLVLLPLALAAFALDLAPILAFAAVGNLLLATPIGLDEAAHLVIVAIVNAGVVAGGIMCAVRVLVSPGHPRLRLLSVDDETAAYVEIWVRRMVTVVVFGVAAADVALFFGLDPVADDALVKLVVLVAYGFAALIVLQNRRAVASRLRPPDGATGVLAMLRRHLAETWHVIAVFLILAQWFVWATDVKDGEFVVLRYTLVTLAVIGISRLLSMIALGTLDRLFRISPDLARRLPGLEARANRYYPVLHGIVTGVIAAVAVLALFQVWGLDAFAWFGNGSIGARLVSALTTIAITAIAAVVAWEASILGLEMHLARLRRAAMSAQAARWQTLLPMLRTTLLVVVLAFVTLTVLSVVGVNIGPLLAGAGIVGIAVGFGSQKLVQDLITGIFLLLENAMQVGDWVTVSGLSGAVESLSIRTIRLRAGDGSVHLIPFSAVTSVTNTTRGVGNASVTVSVDAREDPDRVGDALKAIAEELRADPAFAPLMLGGLDLWGVDKIDGSTVTLAGQIVCTDGGRWPVQREFNRRMKRRFQELDITIANSAQTIVLRPARRAPTGRDPGQPIALRADRRKLDGVRE